MYANKINENIILEKKLEKIIIHGDPGCDGYNTENVAIFETILKQPADLHICVGDLVAFGAENTFRQFIEIIENSAAAQVFCLPGNHDIIEYSKFLGRKNYYIKTNNLLLILLDNSTRRFEEQTLKFLEDTLTIISDLQVLIFFHIPPENPCAPNSFNDNDWQKLKSILDKFKSRINAIICGHIHSAYTFVKDGYLIYITGGAGSLLDNAPNNMLPKNEYHYLEAIITAKNELIFKSVAIRLTENKPDYKQPQNALNLLETAINRESSAYRKYKLYSEIAENEGLKNIAKLFKATAVSEYYHYKNMMIAAGAIKNTFQNLAAAIADENEEANNLYLKSINQTESEKSKQAVTAFKNAIDAEKLHFKLFLEAQKILSTGNDIEPTKYFICTRCGFLMHGVQMPKRCPACNADMFKFYEEK